ncbi:MAG: hypothetical protein IJV43_09405, partial [Oscillospiraceae bacterium]|nr:hypothetical protein [Oscillospiraceae bacterium]
YPSAFFSTRPCLKNADMPKRRVFFRHTAAIFLAIHKVLPRQIGLVRRKNPSPLGTLPILKQGLAKLYMIFSACQFS